MGIGSDGDGLPRLTSAQLAATIRDAMRDQRYRESPLGATVGRYIRWLRNERGCTPSTVRDYEATLARMAVMLADRSPAEVSIEDLRVVIDSWGDRAAKTRAKVTSTIRAFWQWALEEGVVDVDPSARIRRPKTPKRVAEVLPTDARRRLLSAARSPRDRVALQCLLFLGVRRAELAGVRMRDFDLGREAVRVRGKGQKERLLPMPAPMVAEVGIMLDVPLPHVGRLPWRDDFLLYPGTHRIVGRRPDRSLIHVVDADPTRPLSPPALHRWWYGLCSSAGLASGTSGLNMHRARHTLAMEMRRTSGIDAASNMLGHSELSTTLGIYGHFDDQDLRVAVAAHAAWVAEQDA